MNKEVNISPREEQKNCLPKINCKRPFLVVPFKDKVFGHANPTVIRQHAKWVVGRKLRLIGENRLEMWSGNDVGGRRIRYWRRHIGMSGKGWIMGKDSCA